MMHLFGGCCPAGEQAVLTQRMCFKILPADSSPAFAAVYLFAVIISHISVVSSVSFCFMFCTVLPAIHGKLRAARISAWSAWFYRHRFHLAFRVKGKTHTDGVVRMSLICFIPQLYSTKNKPSHVVAKCCKACTD